MKLSVRIGIFASTATAVVLLMTSSLVIAGAFGTLAAGIAYVTVRSKSSMSEAALVAAWPEVIDHLMSGIQSGLSLSESLAGLATRGPEVLRPSFVTFKANLFRSGDLTEAIEELRTSFAHHGSDQIFEALLIAKSLGGSELLQILRRERLQERLARRTPRTQRRRQRTAGIVVPHFPGDPGRAARGVKPRDRSDAAPPRHQRRPGLRRGRAAGRDRPQTSDHDTTGSDKGRDHLAPRLKRRPGRRQPPAARSHAAASSPARALSPPSPRQTGSRPPVSRSRIALGSVARPPPA